MIENVSLNELTSTELAAYLQKVTPSQLVRDRKQELQQYVQEMTIAETMLPCVIVTCTDGIKVNTGVSIEGLR